MMRHYWSLQGVQLQNTWLTIGSFDGVHCGHQEIVKHLSAGAHAAASLAVVLTFFPHPSIVLGKRTDPFYLTTSEERAELLAEAGADVVITFPFDRQVAATSAHDFIAQLSTYLGMRHLLVGHDFALGRNREGNVEKLQELGGEFGYTLETMPPFKIAGLLVSSSRVRAALAAGDMQQAALLLGRPYQVNGEVILGDGRGRTIGIPTANLDVWMEHFLPKAGVYVCQALVNGATWGAVTNVGVRPTFENQPISPRVETHLLDFDQDIYGEKVQLRFLTRLREEQRFPSIEALVAQIRRDITRSKEILAAKH